MVNGRKIMSDDQQFDKVYTKVKEVITEVFSTDGKELTLETKFIDDLGAESLEIITLLMEFEDAFDRQIPDEDAEKMTTVGAAVNYIMDLIKEPSPG
jgi:acyl carrier protein